MKFKKFLTVPFILIALLSLTGCPEKKANTNISVDDEEADISYGVPISYGTEYKESQILNMTNNNRVSVESMTQYFKPDYTKETADPELLDSNTRTLPDSNKNEKSSESVIPGIRNLSQYKTVYNSERKKAPEAPKTVVSKEEYASSKNEKSIKFEIEDWGPGNIVSENDNPIFYVSFTKPVKALTALSEPSDTNDIMSISPYIKGVFRWYGTNVLAFEASEPADPRTVYTITINKKATSLDGDKISGTLSFKTTAEPVEIRTLIGGYEKENIAHYNGSTGALPPYENRFMVRVNYKMTQTDFNNTVQVKVNNKTVSYSSEPCYEHYMSWYYGASPVFNKEKEITNTYIVTIKDPVPHNSTVKVIADNSYMSYETLQPFTVSYVNKYSDYSYSTYGNPLSLSFSQKPDLTSFLKNVKIEGFTLTKDNVKIKGRNVIIHSLKVDFDTTYSLTISSELKDVYGQKLESNSSTLSYEFKTKPVQGYVKYIDYGARIMEAQFPHKLIFEHQNILEENSYYVLSATNKPLNPTYDWEKWKNTSAPENIRTKVQPGPLNQRKFEEIDLNPYLTNGYGFVKFESHIKTNGYGWYKNSDIYDNSNLLTIQVTDFAATARIGINKAVIMLRSLKNGKPVANAKVSLVYDQGDTLIASGISDNNGLAIINFDENAVAMLEQDDNYHSQYYLQLLVEKGDDKMIFQPSSHNTWSEGISTKSLSYARKPNQRTFMFVDRGVYKPGETVTFRGIDRDQVLGNLQAVKTNYTINVQGAWWDAENIIPEISGSTSESGGFYGSFQLPEDLGPGTYQIRYNRSGTGKYNYESITFTVAYFERVKFESSVEITNKIYYGGDTVPAQLSASYLAGGALGNASYEATWYRTNANFTPDTPQTKGFRFSNYTWDSDRRYWSEESGSLSSKGTANLLGFTEKITNGRPQIYKVESRVTDVSNQRIAASASVMVHPASYYFGIARPRNVSGYPKKGTKLEFPYILVDVNGNILNETKVKNQVRNLSYSLSREEWSIIHEQSVDDTIYTRYERSDVVDETGKISPKSSGIVEITPKNCGWYTLKIDGTDENNNNVSTTYEFYVSGGSSYWFDTYNSQSLKLTPDQSEYNPGDTAQILLESPLPKGDYLITVEREGIFTEEIRHLDSTSSIIEIPIAGNYVPVVYVSISSYSERPSGTPTHQYGETDLDKPKGYYGVTPVFVNPYVRAFSIQIETNNFSYKPGENATITLTATRGGKPIEGAELTVMAVDRGVLDLINYHVPNPINYFYSRNNFPLYVRGGDSRDMIMDPVTYSVKNLNGGDAEDSTKEEERKDFRPTACFEPVLITDKNGKASCTFKMPDSLTTYRITAFGVKDDHFALKENEVKVQNPINIQQVQPRRLRVRDTAECGVLITNLQNKGFEVTVSAEVRSPTKDTAEDKLIGRKTVPGKGFIDGDNSHKVYVAPGESTVVYFDVGAEQNGTVELVYTIKSDILNEKLVSPIKIETTYCYETVVAIGQTDSDTASITEQLIIPSWAKDGRGDLKFTLDATRLGVLGSSVNYLFKYPYGCMEQQSSKVLPLVLFDEYIDIFGMNSEVADVKKCVTSFTQKWKESQLSNGGFPYWPNGSESNLYVSTRIAWIYGAAIERGYTAKEIGFDIKKLTKYIAGSIDEHTTEYQKAFACYVMAINKDSSLDSMLKSLYENKTNLSLTAEALVGLAYAYKGDKTKAEAIMKDIRPYIQPFERGVSITPKNKNRNWWWYETPTDEMALFLKLFVTLNPNDKMVDRLLITLLHDQQHGYWNSTTTTGTVLDAIHTYIKKRDLDNTNFTGSVTLNKKEVMSEKFQGVAAKPKTLSLPFEDKAISSLKKDSAIPVTFKKDGSGYMFYTMEMKYALPDEIQNYRDEGLNVIYEITDVKTGDRINADKNKNSVINLEAGKEYQAKITISSTRNREFVAMRCPVPSGAEIVDDTFVTTGGSDNSSVSRDYDDDYYYNWYRNWSNQEILDNEVQYFWDDLYNSYTVTYKFRASRRGVYPTPPVMAECMYEPEVFGRSNGYLFVIN